VVGDEVFLGGSHDGLDLVGVDDSGDVGVGEDGPLQLEVALLLASLSEGAEDGVQCLAG